MPEGVAEVAAEERIIDLMTLTAEPGVIGGVPAGGLNFGAATNAQAIIDQPYQFDFYDGGGLDIAFLGLAQADAEGNLNVSQVRAAAGRRRRLHQHQPERQGGGLLSAPSLPAGCASRCATGSCRSCRKAGRASSCAKSSTAPSAAATPGSGGQPVLYVTERCVFRLAEGGLELIEIAPGIDLERDILAHDGLRAADPGAAEANGRRASSPTARWGCATRMLAIPLERRLTYDADAQRPVHQLRAAHGAHAAGRREHPRATWRTSSSRSASKVYAIVNYDNFEIAPEVEDEYAQMVKGLVERYYWNVTRYTTSGFLRLKLGQALPERGVAPHIYESSDEALKHLREIEDDAAG